MVTCEFQAVVMAGGKGSRMTEITAGRPKCLLPIGNQPMVWYPLRMLEQAGFQDVILIVLETVRSDVQLTLDRCGLKIRLDIVGIPAGEDWGTADSLRFLGERIKSDVLVVSCDLVTDVNLHEVLNMFRKHHASITALFFQNSSESSGVTPGPKTKYKPERDLVGLDACTSRLVFLASASDFEETLSLPRALIKKHQHILMHSRLSDAHLYVLRQWVCQYLAQEKSFSTLKGELLPYIVKKQLLKPIKLHESDPNASITGVEVKKDILHCAGGEKLENEIQQMSTYNDHRNDMHPAYHGDSIRCFGYVAPADKFGMRANTLPVYCHLNRKITELWPLVTGNRELIAINPTSEIKSTQVDGDCMVGEQSFLSEKTSFKASSIGAHCTVESKVRVSGCIIMNGVKIREGCVLSNCVVCDEAEIGSGAELKDCLVGSNHCVPAGEKRSSEVLTDMDRLMEI
ncbi:translation initiation factor eIF2B subunit gamma [Anabrus simplex]|uniref:translation initiation factor eIF2B subunit gamma n=1 Tax=Anabrus simplex TaxID=316456 RepID=UPI0034DDB252